MLGIEGGLGYGWTWVAVNWKMVANSPHPHTPVTRLLLLHNILSYSIANIANLFGMPFSSQSVQKVVCSWCTYQANINFLGRYFIPSFTGLANWEVLIGVFGQM